MQRLDVNAHRKVSQAEQVEIEHLAQMFFIDPQRAKELVQAFGTDRITLEKLAKGMVAGANTVRSSRV